MKKALCFEVLKVYRKKPVVQNGSIVSVFTEAKKMVLSNIANNGP